MPQKPQFFLACNRPWIRWAIPVLAILTIGFNWATCDVEQIALQQEVNALGVVEAFEHKRLYAGLLVFTISFPLLFSFLPRLRFQKQWLRVLIANVPVTGFFILWDAYFTQAGVWGFSDQYTTGTTWLGLPWEEWFFFLFIPFACVFIYYAIEAWIRHEMVPGAERILSPLLILSFFGIGIFYFDKIYTSTTALLAGFFLLFHVLCIEKKYRGKFYLMFLLSCIPFLMVNGILTGALTSQPVVMYHPQEILGIRIRTIPVEDLMYSFLMLLANVTFFENIRTGHSNQP